MAKSTIEKIDKNIIKVKLEFQKTYLKTKLQEFLRSRKAQDRDDLLKSSTKIEVYEELLKL